MKTLRSFAPWWLAVGVLVAHAQDRPAQPLIQILEPEDGAVYFDPASIGIEATSFVPGGYVDSLEVLVDGERVGSLNYCPLNANCRAPQEGIHLNLPHFYLTNKRTPSPWSGAPSGFYTLTARGLLPGTEDEYFESDPVRVAIWRMAPERPILTFMQMEFNEVFQTGERIPLEIRSVLPSGHLSYAEVFADGERIGYASDCPPNAFCTGPAVGQRSTKLTFYQDGGEISDWGYWTGVEPGGYHLTVKGQHEDHGMFESQPWPVIVTDSSVSETPAFVLPVPGARYHLGEPIPIELRMRVPGDRGVGSLLITANGETIGYVSECPPNADCGLPEKGTVVRLVFYPNDLAFPDSWGIWNQASLGKHELAVMSEDPETGELTELQSLAVTVVAPELSLLTGPNGGLTLRSTPLNLAVANQLEYSEDLIQWSSMGPFPESGSILLSPLEEPMREARYFRLAVLPEP